MDLRFACIPPLIWCAFRFSQCETAAATLLLSAISIWNTLQELGPFALNTPNESLLILQAFNGIASITVMALAAAVSERKMAEQAITRTRDELERRVTERAGDLAMTNKELRNEVNVRRQVEEELRSQTRALESILESVADGVVVCDKQGGFLLFNSAAKHILGVGLMNSSPAEWVRHFGCYLPDGITPCPTTEFPLVRAMEGISVDEAELVIRNTAKTKGVWVSVNARPLRLKDDSGAIVGGVVVFRDITDRKRSDEQLKRSNQLLVGQQQELLDALYRYKKANEE